MAYITTESNANVLIPKELANEIFDGIVEASTVLNHFDRLPNMTSRTRELPVLDALGSASFVGTKVTDDILPYGEDEAESFTARTGIAGLKDTSFYKWRGVKLIAETLAVILPVPNEVLADSQFDIWQAMRPRIVEAFGKVIDQAIIWGKNRPASWASGIVPTAIARGLTETEGTNLDKSVSNLMGKIEELGYDPTGFIVSNKIKKDIRILKDSGGKLLFIAGSPGMADTLWGVPVIYSKNGAFEDDKVKMVVGDMKQAKFSIREDINFMIADTGVLTNEYGEVEINLFQENVKAMRVEMRMGWAVPNPVHQLMPTPSRGYPFAVMFPKP